MAKQYVYRDGTLRILKPGASLADWQAKHPQGIVVKGSKPGLATLETWSDNGIAKALDGCRVEPDGTCPHGAPSWMLVIGVI